MNDPKHTPHHVLLAQRLRKYGVETLPINLPVQLIRVVGMPKAANDTDPIETPPERV